MNLKDRLNYHGSKKEPFLFIISYDMKDFDVIPLTDIQKDIKYQIDIPNHYKPHQNYIKKTIIDFNTYKTKFNKIQEEILNGNTYLANLTTQTNIEINLNLEELYDISNAKFKLYYKDKFICFSPERFCKIENNKIYTYPMKGTIDANIANAKQIILEDKRYTTKHLILEELRKLGQEE